ncbi:spore germination protein, partial [Klebsiella pneumoniae]|nr:spore germination protein [Klebsiella pneumoniae]
YPLRVKDYSDTFLRLPLNKTEKRKTYLRPKSIWRYHPNPERKKKNDFDE